MNCRSAFIALTALLCASNGAGAADGVESVLREVGRAYSESPRLHLIAQVDFHPDAAQRAPSFRRTIELKRLGAEVLYSEPGKVMLSSPTRTLLVDLARREIHYRSAAPKALESTEEPSDYLAAALALFAEQGTVIRRAESAAGKIRLVAHMSRGEIRTAEIIIDARTKLPLRVEYRYAAGSPAPEARAEITYSWLDASALRPEQFAESRFVRFEDGQARPGSTYTSFRVVVETGAR